jgi:hypothetical protein
MDKSQILWSSFLREIQRRLQMSIVSHIDQLKQKHVELEGKIEEAMRHPSMSDGELAELKRQKLLLKDKINQLKN